MTPWLTLPAGAQAAQAQAVGAAIPRIETARLVLRAPRIADFDVYAGKEKVSWTGVPGEKGRGEGREALGLKARANLLGRLEPADRERLEALEAEILSKNW